MIFYFIIKWENWIEDQKKREEGGGGASFFILKKEAHKEMLLGLVIKLFSFWSSGLDQA